VLPARLSARRRDGLTAALPAGRWIDRPQALQMGLPAPVRKLLEA
jgi:A/G-specific adenine glycosylase